MLSSLWAFVLAVLFFFVSYTDIKYRVVYNWVVICVLVLGVVGSFVFGYRLNFLAFFLCLLIGIFLWRLGIVGGGDVKLASAYIISVNDISSYLFLVGLIGFFVALVCLITRVKNGVPYAIGISASHLILFLI